MEATKNPEPSREDNNNVLLEDSTTGKITCKMVQCRLCKDEYSETHMEFHLVGVHGVDGPKEMYTPTWDSEKMALQTSNSAQPRPKCLTRNQVPKPAPNIRVSNEYLF